ncbi:hypothetical protein ACFQZC_02235 [Streptacidiphilus monticola]
MTVPEIADFASVDLLTALEAEIEPSEGELLGSVMLRRVAHRFAPGTRLPTVLAIGGTDSYPEFTPPARALATGAGVLCNAEDPEFVHWMGWTAVARRLFATRATTRCSRCPCAPVG